MAPTKEVWVMNVMSTKREIVSETAFKSGYIVSIVIHPRWLSKNDLKRLQ